MTETTELLHTMEQQQEDAMTELTTRDVGELTVDQLVGQIEKVQDAMRRAMVDGEHYGVIPGTGKPSLLKPGAEKLCLLFRLAPTYEITRREPHIGHVEYEVLCQLRHIESEKLIASGVGLCTTMESRYRWRKGSHACPHCGESAIIKGKEEYGGGWLCWKKKDGCGAKFGDEAFSLDDLKAIENPDLADSYNTVLKMAKKRAHVDATLTATAASDIFTQDMEESVSFVGTTPSPDRMRTEEVGPEDAPFDQPGEPVMASPAEAEPVPQIDDLASWYWETIKQAGITRPAAMAALKARGGDFMDAMASLEQQQQRKDGEG